MSDVQGLIEEARSYVHPDSAHALYLLGALADALESEVALREALRAKVNALADEWHDDEQARVRDDQAYERRLIHGMEQRLRALIVQEDTEKEDQR